jgi:hypothetical protein
MTGDSSTNSDDPPSLNQKLEELVDKDLKITKSALNKVKIIAPKKSYSRKIAEDFYNMAQAYYEDANHFKNNGDLIRALACVNYAHGWLDAGARLGIFDVSEDDRLFTLAE